MKYLENCVVHKNIIFIHQHKCKDYFYVNCMIYVVRQSWKILRPHYIETSDNKNLPD